MRDKKTAGKSGHLSRRKFIAGSGAVLGGMLAGAGLVLPGCAQPPATRTVTLTSTRVQFVSPYDGKTFDTFEELTEHIQANYPDRPPLTRYVSPYDGHQFASLEEFRNYLDGLFARSGFVGLNVNGT
ncbi:MAG: twin-arginine translocation signal domain-containing protein, partial [Dehalococcoidia bacterium]